MKYNDFLQTTSLSKLEIIAYAWGTLIEDPPREGCGMLPAPPLLMFDRITQIRRQGNKGHIVAEQDIHLDDWFFQCHFRNDPVQPGCLGVDAVWQLIGLYGMLCGAKGSGRALGAKEVVFLGQIRPHNKIVCYDITIKRFMLSKTDGASFIIGSATVSVDGEVIYSIEEAKVGAFVGIKYNDYPHMSKNAKGGILVD